MYCHYLLCSCICFIILWFVFSRFLVWKLRLLIGDVSSFLFYKHLLPLVSLLTTVCLDPTTGHVLHVHLPSNLFVFKVFLESPLWAWVLSKGASQCPHIWRLTFFSFSLLYNGQRILWTWWSEMQWLCVSLLYRFFKCHWCECFKYECYRVVLCPFPLYCNHKGFGDLNI